MRFPFLLLFQNLRKHPVRTVLTVASLMVAFFLLCVLTSLVTTIEAGVKNSKSDRVIIQSAVSLFVDMPRNYREKIKNVPGVTEVCSWNWFGGVYEKPENFFANFAVDHDTLFSCYPEIEIQDGSKDAFLKNRKSAIVGRQLAAKFGWTVGRTIPLQGTIYPMTNGQAWEIEIAAIYRSTSPNVDEQTMFFRYDLVRETQDAGAAMGPEGVGVYVAQVSDGVDPVRVMREIDTLFANGPQRTQSTSEAEFQAQFVTMLGSVPFFVGAIGTGVFFAILLAVINTMLMASREQTRDVGILKALGFSNGTVFLVFLGQSLLLSVLGGGLGVLLSKGAEPGIAAALGTRFPGFTVLDRTILSGFLGAVTVGIVAGLAPAFQLSRSKVVDALRAEA